MNPLDYTPLTVQVFVNFREAQHNGMRGVREAGDQFIEHVVAVIEKEYDVELVGKPYAPSGTDFSLAFALKVKPEPKPEPKAKPAAAAKTKAKQVEAEDAEAAASEDSSDEE